MQKLNIAQYELNLINSATFGPPYELMVRTSRIFSYSPEFKRIVPTNEYVKCTDWNFLITVLIVPVFRVQTKNAAEIVFIPLFTLSSREYPWTLLNTCIT